MGLFKKTEAQKRESEDKKAVSSFQKICGSDQRILGRNAFDSLTTDDGQDLTSLHKRIIPTTLLDDRGAEFYKKELYGFLITSAREGDIQRRIENGVMKFYLTEKGKTKMLERQDKSSS